jgi:hypothetical protein
VPLKKADALEPKVFSRGRWMATKSIAVLMAELLRHRWNCHAI